METKSLRIELGDWSDVTDLPILEEHWDEVAKNKKLMVLNPDWAKYKLLADAGMLFCLVAYADNEIVGYSFNMLDTHLHYADLVYCNNDVLFVKKEYRSSTLGLRLIKETELEAKRRGAELMLWHAKEHTSLARIFELKKYKVQDIIYSKEL